MIRAHPDIDVTYISPETYILYKIPNSIAIHMGSSVATFEQLQIVIIAKYVPASGYRKTILILNC